jgi:hypothetical protein
MNKRRLCGYTVFFSLLLTLWLVRGIQRGYDRRTLFVFCLDASASLSSQEHREMLRLINTEIMPHTSRHICEFIEFGSQIKHLSRLPSHITPQPASDLAGAIQLALLRIQKHRLPAKIALFSDGQVLDLERILSPLVQQHIPVFVWHPSPRLREVRLIGLVAPEQIAEGVKIPLRVTYASTDKVTGDLCIYANDKPYLQQKIVTGISGQASIDMEGPPQPSGQILWRAEIHGDSRPENNCAFAMTQVFLARTVVLVSERQNPPLLQALAMQHLTLQQVSSAVMPPSGCPVVILDQPTAQHLAAGNRTWEEFLDQGGAILVIAGENITQPWLPAQPRVPSPDPPRREETPPPKITARKEKKEAEVELRSVAMLFIIDQSGSMAGEKLMLAQQAALRSVSSLWPQDWIGVLAFSDQPRWILPLLRDADQEWAKRQIMNIQAGGGTSIAPALVKGLQALRESPAHIKHIILLSDGQDQDMLARRTLEPLVAEMRRATITITAIGIGKDYDPVLMPMLARWGSGEFYYAGDFQEIPTMVLRDVDRILQFRTTDKPVTDKNQLPDLQLPLVPPVATPIKPAPDKKVQPQQMFAVSRQGGDLLDSFAPFPGIASYQPYKTKAGAQTELAVGDDPLLLHWQWRRGKVMMWCSDMAAWRTWSRYPQFWARLLRFLGGNRLAPASFFLHSEGVDDSHWRAVLTSHAAANDTAKSWHIESTYQFYQETPQTWATQLPCAPAGAWQHLDVAIQQGAERTTLKTAYALGYPAEVANLQVASGELQNIAQTTGGGLLPADNDRLVAAAGFTNGLLAHCYSYLPDILLCLALCVGIFWFVAPSEQYTP